jgi:hypothetical protein
MSDKEKAPPKPAKERTDKGVQGGTAINRDKGGKPDNLGFTLTTKPPPKPKGK